MKKSIITLALVAAAIFSLTSCDDTTIECNYSDIKKVEVYYGESGFAYLYTAHIDIDGKDLEVPITAPAYRSLTNTRCPLEGCALKFTEGADGDYKLSIDKSRTESITLNN